MRMREHLGIGGILVGLLGLVGCGQRREYERFVPAAGAPQVRVLMIGNSLTYSNDLPGLLQQFSVGEGAPIYIEQVTVPLVSLRFHWNRERARERIAHGHFDYVILQDFSRNPVTHPEESKKYFELFSALARENGAKVVLFENWTRRRHEKEFGAMEKTYREIAGETGAVIAPIGAAWRDLRASEPGVVLLNDDRHPTEAGSYLTACVLYDVIYHKRSGDLPMSLQGPKLDVATMRMLRASADGAVERAAVAP